MPISSPDQLALQPLFQELPQAFYSPQPQYPLNNPYWISHSPQAAEQASIDPTTLVCEQWLAHFSGNKPFNSAQAITTLYSGHQFGHYNPQLGDGRATLLGTVFNDKGEPWELQLKGAGPTPYSRQGDGRAVLRSSIREYLCSEAMAGLGIPTTRALGLIGSDDPIYREEVETAAVVARMAPTHIRFGHFEYFFYTNQHEHLKTLLDFTIKNYFSHLEKTPDIYRDFLLEVIRSTARMIALWQTVGFCHGVMNTDNMSILGLTFDYGPFAFLDTYKSNYICNHSDHQGRYAFDQQPGIGLWNLNAFAHSLSPFLEGEVISECLQTYQPELILVFSEKMRSKLGFVESHPEDREIGSALLELMESNQLDYTNTFRQLSGFSLTEDNQQLRDQFIDRDAFDGWAEKYQARLHKENNQDQQRKILMDQHNPKYILRNYLAQQAIDKAKNKDFSEVNTLLTLLTNPYDDQPDMEIYTKEPPEWGQAMSISCSS